MLNANFEFLRENEIKYAQMKRCEAAVLYNKKQIHLWLLQFRNCEPCQQFNSFGIKENDASS